MIKKFWLSLLTLSISICFSSYHISANSDERADLSELSSWIIELDSPDIPTLIAAASDLVVIDYALDGTDQTAFSPDQITALKNSGKKVLAYLCIGKAETKRFYFESDWQTDDPIFLGPLESEGKYHVKFWKKLWFDQALQPYLDRILSQGFDGVYLDGIDDTVNYWISQGYASKKTAKRMVKLVRKIAHNTRQVYGKDFIVCPQDTQDTLDNLSETWLIRYQKKVDCFGISNLYSDTSVNINQLIAKILDLNVQKILNVEDESDSDFTGNKIITYVRNKINTPSSSFPTDPIAFDKDTPFTLTTAQSNYWIFVPNSYDDTHSTPTRLFVWLHGCGGASEYDIYMVSPGGETQNWISIAIGGREGDCWSSVAIDGPKILTAIADIKTHFNIDPRRVVLGGYSSGGDIGYPLAFQNANLFAGVLFENTGPDTQALQDSLNSDWKLNIVHLAHTSDDVYPIDDIGNAMDTLESYGFPVTLIEKPGTHWDDDAGNTGTAYDLVTYLLPYLNAGWQSPLLD